MYPLNGRSVGLSVCLSVEKMYIPGARKKTIWVFFKLRKGASSTRFDGQSVRLSVRLSKKILQLENDLSEQIIENESYSGS